MKLLTVKEVADILNVTEQTVYNLTSKGKLNPTKVGRAVRIKKQELNRFIDDNTIKPEERTEPETVQKTETAKKDNKKGETDKRLAVNQLFFSEDNQKEEVLSTKEVAKIFDVTPRAVQTWLNDGKLQGFKKGRGWKVTRQEVERFKQERRY
ncbi:MAG: helix-turn-helix domain-containing protein [Halanaerobiales bacterium]|nr:helix-turn-helix domain-containing protein [Halanaerobiales bacterium]